ncbi:MAG TPA: hypothetical protein PK685_03190 [archaeon]|nr:hypothetical protein [archaeon]
MKDQKKEDEEYLDSVIEKQNNISKTEEKEDPKESQEEYNKYNTKIIIGILIMASLPILFLIILILGINIPNGLNDLVPFVFYLGSICILFAIVILFISVIYEFIALFNKDLEQKLENKSVRVYKHKVNLSLIITACLLLLFIISAQLPAPSRRSQNPTVYTAQLLRQQINYPGVENCTDKVTFKRNSSLIAESIIKNTGLDNTQVYLNNLDNLIGFESTNSQILKYTGSSNKNVEVCIICSDNGKTGLQQAMEEYGITTVIDSNIERETLCLVYPKKA